MTVGNFLLVHVFTALLPPIDDSEPEYYAILGLEASASLEDIRKAYKTKSLQLHPDKVAQRRQQNSEEAAKEYEKVQEAYSVLSDREKRKLYNSLGKSPARYRFIATGGIHSMAAMENLQKASFADKTRLVLLVTFILAVIWLQPILIAAKVNAYLQDEGALQDTKWVAILTPLWILAAFDLAFWILLAVTIPAIRREVIPKFIEHICWLAGIIVIAKQWDSNASDSSHETQWHKVSTPFYLAVFFRIFSMSQIISRCRFEQSKMVSQQFLENLEGSIEDLGEDKLQELATKYTVITTDPEVVAAVISSMQSDGEEVSDEDVEAIRVQTSPEFRSAQEVVMETSSGISKLVCVAIPFIALVAAKLEDQIDGSWWVVFIPIWISTGWQFIQSLLIFCCVGSSGVGVIVESEASTEESERNEPREAGPEQERTSTKFASVEGDIKEFNDKVDASDSGIPSDEEQSLKAVEETKKPDPPTADEEAGNTTQEKTGSTTQEKTGSTAESPDEEHGPDADDMFRAWQESQAAADRHAEERRMNACALCCLTGFQLMIVCLIVAKLEHDYKLEPESDPGYSAFIVLVPVFVVTGIVLCCCTLVICATGGIEEGEVADTYAEQQDADVSSSPANVLTEPADSKPDVAPSQESNLPVVDNGLAEENQGAIDDLD